MVENKIKSFLKTELKKKNTLLFVLIDSKISQLQASSKLAKDIEKIGVSAILGGGIKDAKTAKSLAKAGADALVIGTFLEKGGSVKKLAAIIKAIQRSKQ